MQGNTDIPVAKLFLKAWAWRIAVLAAGVFGLVHGGHFAARLGISPDSAFAAWFPVAAKVVVWFGAALVLVRALDDLVWDGLVPRRWGVPTPQILSDLADLVIWMVAAIGVVAFVFELPVTGLVATSSVTIAVIGFALRSMIADLFSGIAMSLERPFHVGDWIELSDGSIGKVEEVTWRATRLVTRDNITVVAPNAMLSGAVFRNFNRPDKWWRAHVDITLGYDVTSHQAERLLLAAANEVAETLGGPEPAEARITGFKDHGVEWQLRFWVPDYWAMSLLRYQVQRNILRNLYFAGLEIPVPSWKTFEPGVAMKPVDHMATADAFLGRLPLFEALTGDELAELAGALAAKVWRAGEPVVRQGEDGDSLFVVKEGLLGVFVGADEEGAKHAVAHLKSGDVFGEMSLLTGAKRGATVTPAVDSYLFEVTKADFAPLLHRREEVAASLSDFLARRQMANAAKLSEIGAQDPEAERETLGRAILGNIRKFFGIGPKAVAVN